MPDFWMDVDTNLSEVPVNMVPLIDDTDFKTIEAAIAYNAGGMALYWHFVTTAGAYSVTAVTPTTGGDYDWTDQGDAGIYTIEIPASGGASINNDTEGFGWFTGVCTGVLPWRGPVIGFRAAALNNALIDGGDLLDVNVTHVADTSQTGRDIGASVLLSSGTGAGQISLSSGAVLLQATQTGVTIPTVTAVTNDVGVSAASVRTAVGLSSANLDTQLGDIPTVAEFEARTTADPATATNQTTIAGYIDTEIGTITTHLTDIKGTGFVKDTHSLPQCLTATGFMPNTEDGSSFSAIPDMATVTNQTAIEGKIDTLDTVADGMAAKMPTNYVMGSSDQADHDGDFVTAAAIKTAMEADGGDLDTLVNALANQLQYTELNGDLGMFNDSNVSQGSIAQHVRTDGTYTYRKRTRIADCV